MRNRIVGTSAGLIIFAAGIVVNVLAWAPTAAKAEEHWGQCEYFGAYPSGHCHCVAPITTTNCSSDNGCDFGPCGES